MEWISVKDRLPENGAQVLVASGRLVMIAFFGAWECTWADGYGDELSFVPTHWMPLPEPPPFHPQDLPALAVHFDGNDPSTFETDEAGDVTRIKGLEMKGNPKVVNAGME